MGLLYQRLTVTFVSTQCARNWWQRWRDSLEGLTHGVDVWFPFALVDEFAHASSWSST